MTLALQSDPSVLRFLSGGIFTLLGMLLVAAAQVAKAISETEKFKSKLPDELFGFLGDTPTDD